MCSAYRVSAGALLHCGRAVGAAKPGVIAGLDVPPLSSGNVRPADQTAPS